MTQPQLTLFELGACRHEELDSYSPFCTKVHRALRRAGLRYDTRYAKSPGDIKKLNPLGQVPVLLVDDTPICDSTRIVQEVERLATSPMAHALSHAQRQEALLWEELADTSLNGFVVAARWADDDNWPRCRDAFFADAPKLVCAIFAPRIRARIVKGLLARDVTRAGLEACRQRFEHVLHQLDTRAPREGFWVAPTLSVADLAIYGQLHSLRCDLTPREAASIAKRTELSAYLDRVGSATTSPERRPVPASVSQLVNVLISVDP